MQKAWKTVRYAAAALVVLAAPSVASAITVFDPTNYTENLLQAGRALEQIHNQVQQIDQATKMLTQNPLQLSPQLTAQIAQARQLFTQAQGIAFDIQKVGADLRTLYPEQWHNKSLADMLAQSQTWLEQDRQSITQAMAAEARAAQAIGEQQSQIDQALQSSSAAQGQTGAIQAGNQLAGTTASELVQIHALLIAQGRALETERMERVARETRALEIQRQAFPESNSVTFTPARSAFGN